MPKYRLYVSLHQYRSFDFEADNYDLACDHADKLVSDLSPSYILNVWDKTEPEEVLIDAIEENQ